MSLLLSRKFYWDIQHICSTENLPKSKTRVSNYINNLISVKTYGGEIKCEFGMSLSGQEKALSLHRLEKIGLHNFHFQWGEYIADLFLKPHIYLKEKNKFHCKSNHIPYLWP